MKWVLLFPLMTVSIAGGAAPPATSKPVHPASTAKTHTAAVKSNKPASSATSRAKNAKTAPTAKGRPVKLVAVRRITGERGMSRNARSTRAARGGRYVKVSTPTYQTHPDPERYQQIQQALAAKGYFKGEANGTWGPDSGDALKRFQADQKLTDDGKISALTLSGLGLGPKHNTSDQVGGSPLVPVVEPPPAPQQVPPATPEPSNPSGIPPAVTR